MKVSFRVYICKLPMIEKRACPVCLHQDRARFERQVLAKEITMTQVADIVGCERNTVKSHFERCLAPMIREAIKADVALDRTLNVADVLVDSHADCRNLFYEARNEGDRKGALKALEVEIKQLDLMARVTGQINQTPSVSLLLSPTYLQLKEVVLDAVANIPEERKQLGEAFTRLAASESAIDGDVIE